MSGKNLNEIQETYSQELEKVVTWLKANKLTLNTDKSNFVLFRGPKRKMENNIDIKISGTKIKEKEYIKYLGVLIDNRVSWVHHIRHANLKVSKGIGMLTKLRQFVSKNVLRSLFYAFVQPHVDYGLLVRGGTNKTNTKSIKTNMKKAVRKILFKKYNDHTEPLFRHLNILNFEKSRLLSFGKFMWQIKNDEIPEILSNFSTRKSKSYGNDDSLKFHIPNIKLEITKNSIFYQGPKSWNNIPSDIKNKKSLQSFKNSYKKYLMMID